MFRFQVFKSNMEYIEKHNKRADNGEVSFRLKMNKFGDITPREFSKLLNGFDEGLKQHQNNTFEVLSQNSTENIKASFSIGRNFEFFFLN